MCFPFLTFFSLNLFTSSINFYNFWLIFFFCPLTSCCYWAGPGLSLYSWLICIVWEGPPWHIKHVCSCSNIDLYLVPCTSQPYTGFSKYFAPRAEDKPHPCDPSQWLRIQAATESREGWTPTHVIHPCSSTLVKQLKDYGHHTYMRPENRSIPKHVRASTGDRTRGVLAKA